MTQQIKGRNFKVVNGGPSGANLIKITVIFDSVTTPVIQMADMKYNKTAAIVLVKDDGPIDDYTQVYAYLHGNMPIQGQSFESPGYRFTDGCGGEVELAHTFAINTGNSKYPGSNYATIEASWLQYKEVLEAGFGVANHTKFHGGYDKYNAILQDAKDQWDGIQNRPRAFVVPTADGGYATLAPYMGYKIVGSQFGAPSSLDDNRNGIDITGGVFDTNTITLQTLNKFLWARDYAGTWDPGSLSLIKGHVDQMFNMRAATVRPAYHCFSHQAFTSEGDLQPWMDWIQYILHHPQNNDTLWWAGMQEFAEYFETKLLVTNQDSLIGNKMIHTVDLSNLPEEGLYRDMTFVVTGGQVNSVSVEGADSFTVNESTGLINIFLKNKHVKSPYDDVPLPQIISAVASGNSIRLTTDIPITQTVFSNPNGDAYLVDTKIVANVTGEGTTWFINCTSPVVTGDLFTYRMDRGDAVAANGLKLPTYMGYPVA